jgi:hypothetical protein
VYFAVPGAIFDFASFSFHVPICGFAAKQAAPAATQTATVNPRIFVFMRAIEPAFSIRVNRFRS